MVYDANGVFLLSREAFDGKQQIRTDAEHYEAVAPKTATSIPQIRRDFTARFSNGSRYLDAAGRIFDQPTHHARKIMELGELYDDSTLDRFIGAAVDEGKMDIKSFRAMLREYNSGLKQPDRGSRETAVPVPDATDPDPLTRDCSYYEAYTKEACHAGDRH